jgi:hypothetical protein
MAEPNLEKAEHLPLLVRTEVRALRWLHNKAAYKNNNTDLHS